MAISNEELLQYVERFKNTGMSYAQIAACISLELDDYDVTKDRVQKLFQKYNKMVEPELERDVFVVGDFHGAPHPLILRDILKIKPSVLILGGDLFDQNEWSTHPFSSGEKAELLIDETTRLDDFFNAIKKKLPYIDMIAYRGNHEDRVMRAFPQKARMLMKDPFDELCRRHEIYQVHDKVIGSYPDRPDELIGVADYTYVMDDILFSHQNILSCEKLWRWYTDWFKVRKLENIKYMVQHHTHKIRMITEAGGWYTIVETGMGGKPETEGYKISYQAKWKPGVLGYTLIHQMRPSSNDHWKSVSLNLIQPH